MRITQPGNRNWNDNSITARENAASDYSGLLISINENNVLLTPAQWRRFAEAVLVLLKDCGEDQPEPPTA